MPSRRWSAALVAAGLVTGTLAACSSPGDSNNNDSSSTNSSAPFKIGVLMPISGPLATTSTVYQAVAKNLGTSKIPGTETIDGRKVQVIVRDDLGTGPGAASAVRQLLDSDKVNAIIGPLYTDEAEAALPLIKKANVLDISLSGCPDCGDGSQVPDDVLGRVGPAVADGVHHRPDEDARHHQGRDARGGRRLRHGVRGLLQHSRPSPPASTWSRPCTSRPRRSTSARRPRSSRAAARRPSTSPPPCRVTSPTPRRR